MDFSRIENVIDVAVVQRKEVAVIGAGAMGEAIVASLIWAGVAEPEDLVLFDVSRARLDYAGMARVGRGDCRPP